MLSDDDKKGIASGFVITWVFVFFLWAFDCLTTDRVIARMEKSLDRIEQRLEIVEEGT